MNFGILITAYKLVSFYNKSKSPMKKLLMFITTVMAYYDGLLWRFDDTPVTSFGETLVFDTEKSEKLIKSSGIWRCPKSIIQKSYDLLKPLINSTFTFLEFK